MKKSFLLVITLLCSSLLALAEMTIYVYKKDGTKIPYVASVVDSIGFVDVATPEAVDLGLPSGTKWANMNVGANKPEDYGDYFAWGETSPKAVYNWQTYKWCNNPDGVSVTKYNKSTSFGVVDNKTILELTDDAANANWGGDWRLPTDVEAQELFNTAYCSWSMITQNGVTGYKVISKINGNSIFLPAAGFYNDNYENGSTIKDVGSAGVYMTCILGYSIPVLTECIFFDISTVNAGSSVSTRSSGHTVRPVLPKESYYTVSFDANGGEGSMPSIKIEHGKNIVLPANTFTKDFSTFVRWSTKADGTGGWYDDQAILNPNTNITLYAQWENITSGVADGNEWVDLGLPSRTKWATMNVGANSPEEYGDYFAWGETEPKSIYNWETYKWCEDHSYTQTKYCTNSDYGTVDNKTTLELSDDAAYVNWGNSWRMPTKAEQDELRNTNFTTWTWTTQNGVKGYKVTSQTNGNSIFLPATGCRNSSDLYDAGSRGYYWSSSLSTYDSYDAYDLYFDSDDVSSRYNFRDFGRSVRPVLR